MIPTLRPGFDSVVRHALFGVQFRDAVDRRVIVEGLSVEIVDLLQESRRRPLNANRSGVFVLHDFPGLPGFGVAAQASPPDFDRYRLTIKDSSGQYLPLSVRVALPGGGLFRPSALLHSPSDSAAFLPLYSAPTRDVPSARACLRAELRAAGNDQSPIPWARLELSLGEERLAEGLTDIKGRALLIFPLPRPREAGLRDSPGIVADRFTWDIRLRAFWHPDRRADQIADFDDLVAQDEVDLLQSATGSTALAPLVLRKGEPLVATSAGSSFLYVIDPGTSP